VFEMVLNELTRATGGDTMARWNKQTRNASITFLRVYNQIKSATHKVTCPSRRIPQQQQLRPFLSTHTIIIQ